MSGQRPQLGNSNVRIDRRIDPDTPNVKAAMYLNFSDKELESQVLDYMRRTGERPNVVIQRVDGPGQYVKLISVNMFVNDPPGEDRAPAAMQGGTDGNPF